MSAYPPPKENVPIYNPKDFEFENIALTLADAKDYYLEYPTAQGKETLQETIINGALTCNDTATINDSLDISQPTNTLNALNIENDEPGYSIDATNRTGGAGGRLTITANATATKDNAITQSGDCVIAGAINDFTGALTLVPRSPQYGVGLRINYLSTTCYGIFKIASNSGGSAGPSTGILQFPDGTSQTTAFTEQVYNYPMNWNNGNWYRLGSPVPLNVGFTSAFVNIPSLQVGSNLNHYAGFSITLEITYNLTGYTNTSNNLNTQNVYTGYNLARFSMSEANGAVDIQDILMVGNMRSQQTISANGQSNSNFTPYYIDYASQTNKNGLEIFFWDGTLPASGNPAVNPSITSYTRSVRIVNTTPTTLTQNPMTRTEPNNQTTTPFIAYFNPQ